MRGAENFPVYARHVDLWRLYEASGSKPVLAAEGTRAGVAYSDRDILDKLPDLALPYAAE